jgi:hypothetical protein
MVARHRDLSHAVWRSWSITSTVALLVTALAFVLGGCGSASASQPIVGGPLSGPAGGSDCQPTRQPVHGFRLAPGKEFNLALGTAADTRPLAEARGMVIRYHDKADRYVYTNHFGMLITATGHECEVASGYGLVPGSAVRPVM